MTLKDVKFSLQNSADPYKVIDFFSTGTLTLCENTRQNNRITLELWDFRAINRDKHPCDLVVEQDDSQRDLSLTCVSDRIYKDIELARDQLRQSCEISP